MSVASLVTRGLAFGGIPALVTHGLVSSAAAVADTGLLGGKAYSFSYGLDRHREELRRRDNDTAKRLAEAERRLEEQRADTKRRKEELRFNQNLARQQQALEAAIREEISRILMERAALIRLIDDEEAALVLLMSLPFKS